MATKKKKNECKHCQSVLPCYEHCQKTESGEHAADPYSAAQADESKFLVDYWCKHCHQSGAVAVDPKDIQWD